MSQQRQRPSVLAVVVATDGEPTLPRTLAGLADQTYEQLAVVAVDNGSSDATRSVLADALGDDAVLVADRDLGFGGAVDMALASVMALDVELVLLVHDDMQLRPDAVEQLVTAFELDPQLAVAGCKLVEWDDAQQLQAVGMRIDVTGRADSFVEDDEIDQGQHDHIGEVLYVSTAGMMVDRARFEALGGFDVRYHLFRDDLDLCWRAHLAGHRVEVVPSAVAEHDASASTYGRLGQTAFLGPRYFAERNTLASLLKNHGARRLLYVLPLFLVVGVAKVVGFLATRRLGDAWQTVRAWVWNVLHLRETRRLRRLVQGSRRVGDAELRPLFGRVGTRLRTYAEAFGDAVAGGSSTFEPVDPDHLGEDVPTVLTRARRAVQGAPVLTTAALLAVLGTVVALRLLGPGDLRGGELAAWPSGWATPLEAYLQPWEGSDMPGTGAPSALLPVLSVVSALAGGSAWLAPRLLLLAVVPAAWLAALAAGRVVTDRRAPRAAAATLYALSPPVLAALRTGQVRAAVAAGLLPLALVASGRVVGPRVPVDRAWRAAALLAVVSWLLVGAVPSAAVLVLVTALVVLVGIVLARPPDALGHVARVLLAVGGGAALLALSPPDVPGPALLPGAGEGSASLWRVLLLTPDLPGFGAAVAGAGLAAGALLGLLVVDARRRLVAGVLWSTLLASVLAAWWLVRLGAAAPLWPGTALLPGAMAATLLLATALSAAPRVLGGHVFGWRQVASAVTGAVVVAGLVGSVAVAVDDPWGAYARDGAALPAYLRSEVQRVGPFRVLALAGEGEQARWQLTDAAGPTALGIGEALDPDARSRVADVVEDLVAGADPGAAARLGPLGIRYVVVPQGDGSQWLRTTLGQQFDLTVEPAASATVLAVGTWLPRWSVVPDDVAQTVEAATPLPDSAVATALDPASPAPSGDGAVLAEVDVVPGPWQVVADGAALEPDVDGPVRTWSLPAGAEVTVVPDGGGRGLRAAAQLLLLLVLLSLSLRAPRFARPRGRRP